MMRSVRLSGNHDVAEASITVGDLIVLPLKALEEAVCVDFVGRTRFTAEHFVEIV